MINEEISCRRNAGVSSSGVKSEGGMVFIVRPGQ